MLIKRHSIFLLLSVFFFSIQMIPTLSNAADRDDMSTESSTFDKNQAKKNARRSKIFYDPPIPGDPEYNIDPESDPQKKGGGTLRRMAKKAAMLSIPGKFKQYRDKKKMHRTGSGDSIASGCSTSTTATTATTTSTATSLSFQKPEKTVIPPRPHTEIVRFFNGATKTYDFHCCESILLPEAVVAVALAAGDRYIDLSDVVSSAAVNPGFGQKVTVPTDEETEYSYLVTRCNTAKDKDTVELGLTITRHKKITTGIDSTQESQTFPTRLLIKLTPTGSLLLEGSFQTASKLRGYEEQLTDAIYYHELSGDYAPGILVFPSLNYALGDLIIAQDEPSEEIKKNTLGEDHDYLKPGHLIFNEEDMILLAHSLAKSIYEIFEEGFEFKTIPKLNQFGLYGSTHAMFLTPMELKVPTPGNSSSVLDQMISIVDAQNPENLNPFPRPGVIFWLGKVYAMLAKVDSIYTTEVKLLIDFSDPSFLNFLELLKQTSPKEHVIAYLEKEDPAWKDLKPIASSTTPKVNVKHSPTTHLLALATYMLRGDAKHRPTIKHVIKYLQEVIHKHGILPPL